MERGNLYYSRVHNDWTVHKLLISCKTREFRWFVHNKSYIAYSFTVHTSTSGLKAGVIVAFLDSNFLLDARTSVFRKYSRHILFVFPCIFRTSSLGLKWGFRGIGKGWCDIDFNWTGSYFWGYYICASIGENRSRNATVRVRIHAQTQTGIIICPMLYAIAMGQIKIMKICHKWDNYMVIIISWGGPHLFMYLS